MLLVTEEFTVDLGSCLHYRLADCPLFVTTNVFQLKIRSRDLLIVR